VNENHLNGKIIGGKLFPLVVSVKIKDEDRHESLVSRVKRRKEEEREKFTEERKLGSKQRDVRKIFPPNYINEIRS
jgi:hypothetical protein